MWGLLRFCLIILTAGFWLFMVNIALREWRTALPSAQAMIGFLIASLSANFLYLINAPSESGGRQRFRSLQIIALWLDVRKAELEARLAKAKEAAKRLNEGS
jgi:hypothetical protein